MKKTIDLHMHSTVSDGSLSPVELMEAAASAGIQTVALTDHDSTAGLKEAAEAAERLGMEFIRGVELSCTTEFGQVDVLGYYIPLGNQFFEDELQRLRDARDRRNLLILQKLAEMGMPIDASELQSDGQSAVGRPHIAKLMIRHGYVKNVREAFERFIAADKPAYVPKEDFSPAEAVSLLAGLGALPVIAHPMLIHAPDEWLEALVASLVPLGLAGIEAYHSEHDNRGVRKVLALADKYGLIVTGGSDFHGDAKPNIALAKGKGSLCVPETVLGALEKARRDKA